MCTLTIYELFDYISKIVEYIAKSRKKVFVSNGRHCIFFNQTTYKRIITILLLDNARVTDNYRVTVFKT